MKDVYFSPNGNISTITQAPKYKAYTQRTFRDIPQIHRLAEPEIFAIEVVSQVLPFKTNNYVVEELIDWSKVPDDPIFNLTFPQEDMLNPHQFRRVASMLKNGTPREKLREVVNKIRWDLNPHPDGQMSKNRPTFHGKTMPGLQHKYKETVLFFPSHGQTCHAYCTFCFRWPQFVGIQELKFAMREVELLVEYVRDHRQITDVLFTGGDPLIMKTRTLTPYIEALLDADLPNLRSIRIGTKALGYWPYRFLTDPDADALLALFEKVTRSGKHLAFMAHFNHPRELKTRAVRRAIARIRKTGAQIRTQSPLISNINASAEIWAEMWKDQVSLGCIPYYMFVERDTGSQDYFGVPLYKAFRIFRNAYQRVSGLARTVRGPNMSADPGKVQILGTNRINNEKVFVLQFLQARNPDWVMRPFFAKYDENALWLDDLKPALGESMFFFEDALRN